MPGRGVRSLHEQAAGTEDLQPHRRRSLRRGQGRRLLGSRASRIRGPRLPFRGQGLRRPDPRGRYVHFAPVWVVRGCLGRPPAVRFNGHVYLLEFKVVESAPDGAAIAQLKARRYADKYRARGEPIHLIAVEFSREARNLAAFEVEHA